MKEVDAFWCFHKVTITIFYNNFQIATCSVFKYQQTMLYQTQLKPQSASVSLLTGFHIEKYSPRICVIPSRMCIFNIEQFEILMQFSHPVAPYGCYMNSLFGLETFHSVPPPSQPTSPLSPPLSQTRTTPFTKYFVFYREGVKKCIWNIKEMPPTFDRIALSISSRERGEYRGSRTSGGIHLWWTERVSDFTDENFKTTPISSRD